MEKPHGVCKNRQSCPWLYKTNQSNRAKFDLDRSDFLCVTFPRDNTGCQGLYSRLYSRTHLSQTVEHGQVGTMETVRINGGYLFSLRESSGARGPGFNPGFNRPIAHRLLCDEYRFCKNK